jgi:hypothetical protein
MAGGLYGGGGFNIIIAMHIRQLLPQRDSPVEDGKPLQGTWTSAFENVNLLDIDRPYKIPLPKWILDFRLKEWHTFTVQNDDVWLEAIIIDYKFFCFLEIVFWDKHTKENMRVFKTLPFSAWRMPQSLNDSIIEQAGAGFSFCVHDRVISKNIIFDVTIDSAIERPVFTVHLEFELNVQKSTPLAVNMLMAENRSMYVFKCFCGVNGSIVFGGNNMTLSPETASGIFQDCKAFIPYRARYPNCRGFGVDTKGRRFGFSFGEHITKKLNVNNENALWLEGTLTPMPPVRITDAEPGEMFIQDLEGMVDLNFKLLEDTVTTLNFFIIGMEHKNPVGQFNGMLMTRDGEKLPVRNVIGTVECFYFKL